MTPLMENMACNGSKYYVKPDQKKGLSCGYVFDVAYKSLNVYIRI